MQQKQEANGREGRREESRSGELVNLCDPLWGSELFAESCEKLFIFFSSNLSRACRYTRNVMAPPVAPTKTQVKLITKRSSKEYAEV